MASKAILDLLLRWRQNWKVQLHTFAQVAQKVRDHKVIFRVGATFGQRDNMVKAKVLPSNQPAAQTAYPTVADDDGVEVNLFDPCSTNTCVTPLPVNSHLVGIAGEPCPRCFSLALPIGSVPVAAKVKDTGTILLVPVAEILNSLRIARPTFFSQTVPVPRDISTRNSPSFLRVPRIVFPVKLWMPLVPPLAIFLALFPYQLSVRFPISGVSRQRALTVPRIVFLMVRRHTFLAVGRQSILAFAVLVKSTLVKGAAAFRAKLHLATSTAIISLIGLGHKHGV
jgi:hypothetical protein